MRKSWDQSQKDRLERERIQAEQRRNSRSLEQEATRLIREADMKEKTTVIENDFGL